MQARALARHFARYGVPAAGSAALALAALEIFVDWDTWIQLNVSIVYGLPLVVAAASGNRRLLWALALALLAATFVVYAHQIPPGQFALYEPFFVNRVLAALTVLLTAALLHALTVAIEALKARRAAAEEESGRKSLMLASVSHDLRTPLTTINLIADLIQRSAGNPDLALQVRAHAESLRKNALSLSDLLSDVLDISAMDSGHAQLHESEFSLEELLSEEIRRLEPLAQSKGLWLKLRPVQPDACLRADRIKLARIVRNLVGNAIKFTPAGGVEVALEHGPDRSLRLRVADTGIGISPADQRRIFEVFAPLAGAGHEERGWGLGLAISRRLAELMDGAITLESRPGAGSVFTLELPAARVVTRYARGTGGDEHERLETNP